MSVNEMQTLAVDVADSGLMGWPISGFSLMYC